MTVDARNILAMLSELCSISHPLGQALLQWELSRQAHSKTPREFRVKEP